MSIIEKAVKSLGKKEDAQEPSKGGGSRREPNAEPLAKAAVPREESTPSDAQASAAVAATRYRASNAPQDPQFIVRDKYIKLNFEEMRHLGLLTPNVPRSAIAEEFRTIKRPLLTNLTGDEVTPAIKHGNMIMVTSALEGDGKTFTSISLAISIAMEQDKTVLFVDADTAKAEAGRVMGIPMDCPGLIDVLEDDNVNLRDVMLRTNIENLRILPAGDLHTHANELLASDKMRQLMVELSEFYHDRVIVFDSPPLLLTTEASVLASFMGQIVFVVSADQTPQHAVTQAIEHIGEDKMVGMVLNRARRRSNPYYYAYGELYGYGRNRQSVLESG